MIVVCFYVLNVLCIDGLDRNVKLSLYLRIPCRHPRPFLPEAHFRTVFLNLIFLLFLWGDSWGDSFFSPPLPWHETRTIDSPVCLLLTMALPGRTANLCNALDPYISDPRGANKCHLIGNSWFWTSKSFSVHCFVEMRDFNCPLSIFIVKVLIGAKKWLVCNLVS